MDKKNIEAIYPLTSMQQSLLLHAIQQPKQDLGFLQVKFDIRANLYVTVLKNSWQALSNRHQTLRTAIYWKDLEQPLQVVQLKVSPVWEQLDWRHVSNEQQEQKKIALYSEVKDQGIILSQAPLVSVTLIRLADNHYHFICHCHHILLDGWSSYLMIKELFQIYETDLQSINKQLPMAFKYQNYVDWILQQDLGTAKTFWQQQLQGLGRKTWPIKETTKEAIYSEQTQTIESTLTTQLQQLCSNEKITLNAFLQGIWSLLIAKASGQNDLVFGVTVSGRNAPLEGIENAVGMFSNVLPIRTAIKQSEPFLSWVESIAVQQANITHYDYVTLAQIQTWCVTDIQSLFIFGNYAQGGTFDSDSVQISDYKSGVTTNFPLTMLIQPDEQLVLKIIHDNNCLSSEMVTQFLQNWKTLLAHCVANPQRLLSDLLEEIDVTGQKQQEQQESGVKYQKPIKKHLVEPQTRIEKQLALIWLEVLNLGDQSANVETIKIDRHDNFFDLGGRSIMVALLMGRINEVFHVLIPLHRIFEYPTLVELSNFIQTQEGFETTPIGSTKKDSRTSQNFYSFTQRHLWSLEKSEVDRTWSSLVAIQPNGSKCPLFCVPPGGNTALTYVDLAHALGSDQPVYGFQPLGFDGDSKPQRCVKEMAAHYLEEVLMFQPKGPYYLVGICFGGKVAYEMAQQLHAQGRTVAFLGLLDPVTPYDVKTRKNLARYTNRLTHLARKGSLYGAIKYILKRQHYVLSKKYSWIKINYEKRFNPEKARLTLLSQAHDQARIKYKPEAYPGDVTLFRSGEFSDYEKERYGSWEVTWSDLTKGEFNNIVIPGGHSEIFILKNLGLLAEHLKDWLEKAQAKYS